MLHHTSYIQLQVLRFFVSQLTSMKFVLSPELICWLAELHSVLALPAFSLLRMVTPQA